ncbi:Putative fatty-acid--CoA ligase fadD21 [Rubripirellula lacrimiformis]|uniref:Fatty-acid--CoA ligase fadD21 n=1 Tax=Rubripirellula lacrimiformis TaxID=1930273 RepID=A0A517NIU8_9BACT|nr:AMP-binding protein [Rubripirellula lacrimiformis]QDT06973.1 Putative fatty-acid--CoA ligase fadD21 [Rubripirellula lacrimiformis]
MAPPELQAATTLAQWIGKRAELHGQRPAITYLDDDQSETTWSYAELWRRSCAVAAMLDALDVGPRGDGAPRALLLYPPGIEFLSGFLGCQIAGWTPVPTCYPKPGREIPRLDSAANDCRPDAILGDRSSIDGLDSDKLGPSAVAAARVVTQIDDAAQASQAWISPDSLASDGESLALLQYTSGSTSEPKGVMVRHRNVLANLEAIRRGFHIEWQAPETPDAEIECGVFWLPFFHDMGLIGGILEPLYVGGRTVLMSPRSFLQRPLRWLQAIGDHRAMISGAPNFAYQLCVDRISPDQTDGLDLSRWRIAFSGAEPILPRTLQDFASRFSSSGFSSDSFYPCYGLAEATLLAAGGDGPKTPKVLTVQRESLGTGRPLVTPDGRGAAFQKLVSCGTASYQNELKLVDPATCREVGEDTVGEIWLQGTSITGGYWNRDDENAAMFDATLDGGQSGYCRTGDIGFLHQGDLYVTGRLKDVIILRGRNLFPQDIEATTAATIGPDGGQCAAFSVEGGRGEALAIVAELPRRSDPAGLPDLVRSIRRAVIEVHEVDPRHVWLVRPAIVPLTSSGKVQRSRCRELFDADEIKTKYRYDRSSGAQQVPITIPVLPSQPHPDDFAAVVAETETWMTKWLVARAGVDPSDVELEKPFADYGLDSMTAVEMSGEIEDWSGVELTPIVAWNYPTVARLSEFIAQQIVGVADQQTNQNEISDAELDGLLDEIEGLSDDEINHAFADKRPT